MRPPHPVQRLVAPQGAPPAAPVGGGHMRAPHPIERFVVPLGSPPSPTGGGHMRPPHPVQLFVPHGELHHLRLQ
eukprot:5005303-Pyramimonas_sp.AAC.1